jgi:hypothetical protein
MPGKKGQVPNKPQPHTARTKVWQSMRILRRFSIPELCRTSGARRNNVRKFLWTLERHGYVARSGGHLKGFAGNFQGWRLLIDCGPHYPTRCRSCGRPLGEECEPLQEVPHG